MGCTLLAVVLAEEGLYWISVGDSPLWLWRRGRLRRLNQDHAYRSILAAEVSAGEISAADAFRHPARNALVSAVTGDEVELVDLPRQAHPLKPGDQMLLASDGLLTLGENEIAALLTRRVAKNRAGGCWRRWRPIDVPIRTTSPYCGPGGGSATGVGLAPARGRAPLLALLVAALLTLGGAWWLAQDMETVASTAAPP